jgi:hypothetical protein
MFEVWPPGSSPATDEEAPGHFGKKKSWVGLSVAAWPALAALTTDGSMTVSIDESKLTAR